MMTVQLTLDFKRHYIVRNFWSECFHVCDENHIRSCPGEPRPNFHTVEEAQLWAAERGIDARICKSTYVPGAGFNEN